MLLAVVNKRVNVRRGDFPPRFGTDFPKLAQVAQVMLGGAAFGIAAPEIAFKLVESRFVVQVGPPVARRPSAPIL